MRLTASILSVLVIMLTGTAYAQTVDVDYDSNYDYESKNIKTFAWVKSSGTSVEAADPLLHSRIVNGIEYYLTLSGLTEVDESANPDLHVTYHASTKEEVQLNTTSMGYGYPGGWAYGGGFYGGAYGMGGIGMGTSTTSVSTYQMGTLVVDVWDARTDKLVWRGMASNIAVSQDPDKMQKKIDRSLKKMVDKWKKIKKKNAKAKAKAEKKAAKEAAKK